MRRRADEQLALLVAFLVHRAAPEPRSIAAAVVGEDLRPAHGRAGAAVSAADGDPGDVTEGLLFEVELRPLAAPSLAVRMGEESPREVREVAPLACGHEPDGHGARPFVLRALVPVPAVLVLEPLSGPCQPAARLAHEPSGELQRAYAHAGERVSRIPFRGHPEVALAG